MARAKSSVPALFNSFGSSLAAFWLIALAVCALLYPVLPFQDPDISDFEAIATGPSLVHWLGTDEIGRDMLARTISAARISLQVGFLAIAFASIVGGLIGLCAGYFRGRLDSVLMTANDVLLSFPGLIFVIAIVAIFGATSFNVVIALGTVFVPSFARVSRAATLTFAARPFVIAAKSMGANHRQIIFGELAPNVSLSVLAYALTAISTAILAEGGLSFLGLSVPPPAATWGGMIVSGKEVLADAPHIVLFPSIAMFLTVLAFNTLGDKFRKLLDGRESQL